MSYKISRRKFVGWSATALAGAFLAACAPKAPATPEAKEEVKEEATKVPEEKPQVPEKPVWPKGEVPRERCVIRMFGPSEFTDIGICNLYAPGTSHQWSKASMVEPMFYYTALNDKTYAHIAESYEFNEDGTEVKVYLRKNVE